MMLDVEERGRSCKKQKPLLFIRIAAIVIVVMLVGAGAVLVVMQQHRKRIRLRSTKVLLSVVLERVHEWRGSNDDAEDCPRNLRMLVPEYLKKNMLRDAWGGRLKIKCFGAKVCVYSAGPNRREERGGGDDVRACSVENE